MQLESFRVSKGFTYDQLAQYLALKKSTTYSICKGVGEISLRNANLIMERTKGAVAYDDLLRGKHERDSISRQGND